MVQSYAKYFFILSLQPAKEKDIVIFPKSRQYYAKMSLVDLGKRLLEAAKRGETDDVRTLMSNGAPFTTDWVLNMIVKTLDN